MWNPRTADDKISVATLVARISDLQLVGKQVHNGEAAELRFWSSILIPFQIRAVWSHGCYGPTFAHEWWKHRFIDDYPGPERIPLQSDKEIVARLCVDVA